MDDLLSDMSIEEITRKYADHPNVCYDFPVMADNPVKDAIQALYQPIESIVKVLAGPAAEEIGLSFKDSVQTWRLKRQIRLFTEVKRRCDAAGIKPQSVKLSLLFDIVDKGTLEEDDSLQDRWANLLANAADPKYQGLISAAFPDILRQLSNDEAIFLEGFYTERQNASRERINRGAFSFKLEKIFPVYVDNLERLQLIQWQVNAQDPHFEDGEYYTTSFGEAFLHACTTPKAIIKPLS